MDAAVLAALQQRAAEAEARLGALELKVAASALAGTSGLSAGTTADLEELRALLLEAKAEQEAQAAEKAQAIAARKAAEDEVTKLKYRIVHLSRGLREADEKLRAQGASSTA